MVWVAVAVAILQLPAACRSVSTSLAVGYAAPLLARGVEEGFTIPLRPTLRSTASPQTVLRGTVNPSSRQHVGTAPTDRCKVR